MADLPSGTMTFLFTDLEGSTRLWEEHLDAMRDALARHDAVLGDAIERHGGTVVKTTGDGFHAVFLTARSAVDAAVDAQRALSEERWGETGPLRARMGVHTGEAEYRSGDYYGTALNRAARLMATAHGGQIVVSLATEELVRDALPEGVTLVDLGEHRLRDLGHPEHVFQIRHPGLPGEFPPLRSLDAFPGGLPVFLTSFVGRERELATVAEVLGQSRIVTLIGVGGVGKTRLALQVAAEVLPGYADGAWFCELAPVTDRRAVPEAVAACLAVRPQQGESLTTSLLAFLRNRQLLLLLDNCEHVIDAAGSLAEAIAHACPRVVVLATSREALGVDGEVLRPVGSLALPDEGSSRANLTAAASVRLFADRAQAVRPEFTLTLVSAPVVADICRQLDGVPLAIELAAARVASLTVNEIAQRLDQRFRLLTGGRRTALERHQTLRGAVDWSYELLKEREAHVFNRLAVFAGGFTLPAAEVVVSGEEIEATDVLDVLSSLAARSMVVADDSGDTMRYRLLETMRQYARERLDDVGESDAVRRRHAEHYVALAETAAVGLKGRDEERWLRIVDQEFANFRAALDWSVGTGDAELALRLAVTYLGRAGPATARVLQLALDMPEARDHPLRPHAMAITAIPTFMLSADPASLADRVRVMDAAFEEAGLELTAQARFAHAALASVMGRGAEVNTHGSAAVELALKAGDRHLASFQSATLAILLATAGETEAAVERAEQAHALGSELGNPTLLALSETALGYALSTVDPDHAIPHLEAGLAVLQAVQNETLRYTGERCLARLRAARGELGLALERYATILDSTAGSGERGQTTMTCESVAVDLAAAGYDEIAATIIGAVEAQARAYQGNPLVRREAAIEALRRAMGQTDYEKCAARGRAMDTEDLAAFARGELTRVSAELSGG